MNFTSSSLTFLLLLFLLPIISPAFADSYEPDNILEQAKPLTAGEIQDNHSISPENDHDWVIFTLTATEDIELTSIQGLNSPGMEINLYDNYGRLLENDYYSPIIRMRLSPSTYYAEYLDHGNNDVINDYGISLKTTVANGDKYEPDNRKDDATSIAAGVSDHHSIVPANDHDWVKFTLTATEDIELTSIQGLNSPGMEINLYDSHMRLLENDYYSPIIRMRLSPGTYYAEYLDHGNNEEINDYGISLKTTVGSGDAYEPDNRPEDATHIASGVSSNHNIVPANDRDWVKFTLTATDNIELTTIEGVDSPGMRINLYDDYGRLLDYDYYSPKINITLSSGTYYAEYQDHGNNEEISIYSIVLSGTHIAAPPSRPAAPYASDGTFSDRVKVTWSNRPGVQYKVYRCANSSTMSCTKISYTRSPYSDYNATPRIVYYYRIKACNSIGCSAFSSYDSGYRKTPKLPALMTIIQYILNH